MRVRNGPDLFYETSEVRAEGLIFLLTHFKDEELVFLLTHSKEGRDDQLWLGASEEVGLELFRELVERVD
ncbi:hypothetical protein GW17_00041508 [Ensete ventricosum]|nr:hypothetical protein GW17_00041508 [Ensete ventricosum]